MTDIVPVLVNGEWEIMLPKHRADRPQWYTKEGWERARLDSMNEHLDEGDVMYYVGAEEGEMPALCQMWGAKVWMAEPNPKVWPNIRAIWEANKLERPLGCFIGFASNVTEFEPKNLDFDSGFGRDLWPVAAHGEMISDHGFRELYQQADATPQIRLDDLPWEPTALSIDVEGSEWRVLEGAVRILRESKPKIWLSGHDAFMQHQFGENLTALRSWITKFGYKETILDNQHEMHLFYEPLPG